MSNPPSEKGNTVHAQTLGFCVVNHQETSCETIEAPHYITLHERKEGVNKYEVNLAKGTVVQAVNLCCCSKSCYYTQQDAIFTLAHIFWAQFYKAVYSSCHVLLTILVPMLLLTLSRFPSTDFMHILNLHIINEMKMKAFTLGWGGRGGILMKTRHC